MVEGERQLAEELETRLPEWVKRSQNGDTEAFDHIITAYRDKVFGMVYRMVGNEHDAWGVAQEGFLKAWRSLPNFRGNASFSTWLYRIVMNATIDWVRRRRRHETQPFEESVGELLPEAPGSHHRKADRPSARLEREELRCEIEQALQALSPDHRAVIVLKEFDGLSYKEIAAVTGCSTGTVMSRLFYARKKLQNLLRGVYESL